jgi:hypothetical protein
MPHVVWTIASIDRISKVLNRGLMQMSESVKGIQAVIKLSHKLSVNGELMGARLSIRGFVNREMRERILSID